MTTPITDEEVEAAARSFWKSSIHQGYNDETKEKEWDRMCDIWRRQMRTALQAAAEVRERAVEVQQYEEAAKIADEYARRADAETRNNSGRELHARICEADLAEEIATAIRAKGRGAWGEGEMSKTFTTEDAGKIRWVTSQYTDPKLQQEFVITTWNELRRPVSTRSEWRDIPTVHPGDS